MHRLLFLLTHLAQSRLERIFHIGPHESRTGQRWRRSTEVIFRTSHQTTPLWALWSSRLLMRFLLNVFFLLDNSKDKVIKGFMANLAPDSWTHWRTIRRGQLGPALWLIFTLGEIVELSGHAFTILILYVKVTKDYVETERLFNKADLSFGYFIQYTPVR